MKCIWLCLSFLVMASVSIHGQYNFDNEKSIKCPAVEDQQSSNTCWSFATTSFLESELVRKGNASVDLSEMYIVRQIYLDKARNYLLRQGKANFSDGGLSHDVIHAFAAYGAMPEDTYPGLHSPQSRHDHSELTPVLKSVLDAMLAKNSFSDKWPFVINAILDVYLGPVPNAFPASGQQFNADAFAETLSIDTDDYVSLTSYTHHPFYEKIVLEIPDNHANGSYYNLPLDEFSHVVKHALEQGYSIAWDGDVSESSFNAEYGIAVLPLKARDDVFIQPGAEKTVTQEERQRMFETYSTTDDHLMHIVGIAKDQKGSLYYFVKNSWGVIGAHNGYLYMSEAYFNAKTISFMIHKEALLAEIATKLKT